MRSTARLTGVSFNAVKRTLREAGPVAAASHEARVRGLMPRRVELDEVWTFVGAKRANAATAKVAEAGDFWLWFALDPDSKLLISYLLGGRNALMARGLIRDLHGRVETYPAITTDGYPGYAQAVYEIFKGQSPHTELVFHEKRVTHGTPNLAETGTSFVERLNLSLRMENRRYTRKTNAFSKSTEAHASQVALWALVYNFVRRHRTIKTTPAVAAGIEAHPLSMDWVADLIEAQHETPRALAERIGLGDRHRARRAQLEAELDRIAAERAADTDDWQLDRKEW